MHPASRAPPAGIVPTNVRGYYYFSEAPVQVFGGNAPVGPVELPLGEAAVYEPPRVCQRVVDSERLTVAFDGGERRAKAAPVQC